MSIHAAPQVATVMARAGGANGVASMPALRHGFGPAAAMLR